MTIALFFISFIAISLLIGAKMFQTHVRKINFLSVVFSRGDAWIQEGVAQLVGRYTLYRKIVKLFVFDFLPSYTYEVLVKAKDYIAKKYYTFDNDIRGRRVLRNSGSVSFFLERLAEEKPKN